VTIPDRPHRTTWADVLVAALLAAGGIAGGTAIAAQVDLRSDDPPVQASADVRQRLGAATLRAEILRQTRTKAIGRLADEQRDLAADKVKLSSATGIDAEKVRAGLAQRTELIASLSTGLDAAAPVELGAATELIAATEAEQKSRTRAAQDDRLAKTGQRTKWMVVVWALLAGSYLIGRRIRARKPPLLHPGVVTASSLVAVGVAAVIPLAGWPAVVVSAVAVIVILLLRSR
jgi:hypothetical protein